MSSAPNEADNINHQLVLADLASQLVGEDKAVELLVKTTVLLGARRLTVIKEELRQKGREAKNDPVWPEAGPGDSA